jgi:3-deoxy-manno-octulosonate cytidylyltransferase (CMP-KDO synthetase)
MRASRRPYAIHGGRDRVAAVAIARGWPESDLVVNVQGDEPFLPPQLIDQAAATLARDPVASMATLATPVITLAEFVDPNVVKVVTDLGGHALYFTRAAVPCTRDAAVDTGKGPHSFDGSLRHIGLYAYRVGALRRLVQLAPSPLEKLEKLEQLRALQNGMAIAVGIASVVPPPGVDTEADLARARALAAAGV